MKQSVRVRGKHPLLLYRRLLAYIRTPALLLILVSGGLLIWDHPALQGLRLILVMTFLLPLALVLLVFVMSRLAYVQCAEDGLVVQLPLSRVQVPYDSIIETRAAFMYELFPPAQQPFSTRGFLDPLWRMPVVVVRLRSLPQPRQQLRLWMDSRMIIHEGLVFLVRDHMRFRRQVQEAMINWRGRCHPAGRMRLERS